MFDYLKDILFLKQKKFINSTDEQSGFNSYILQRWCSMASIDAMPLLNETTNRWFKLISNKIFTYKILLVIMPQIKYKKVDYLKKKDKLSLPDNMQLDLFLSSREINLYKQLLKEINV